MPFLAGFLPLNTRGLDVLAAGTLSIHFLVTARILKSVLVSAERDAGPVKSMPKSRLAMSTLPVHGVGYFLPPVVYIGAVLVNGVFGEGPEQPAWMKTFSLPDLDNRQTTAFVRVSASLAYLGATWLGGRVVRALGAQWHLIGVRERPKLVSSGPYAIVRHPLYSTAFIQGVLLGFMTWNYIPFISFVVTAAAFGIKIPYEEELMEEDPKLGPQYKAYKKRVPWRVIPYIW